MGYTDFSFQSDHDGSKSMTSYIFTVNGRAICWKSFKQHMVANSICEAKYIAASDIVKETGWLRKFINELGMVSFIDGPILLHCDSIGAIAQAKKSKSHQRTKHILHRYHLVHEIVDRDDVELQKIDENKNLTNPFTKAQRSKRSMITSGR